jgi:hypothetical protein
MHQESLAAISSSTKGLTTPQDIQSLLEELRRQGLDNYLNKPKSEPVVVQTNLNAATEIEQLGLTISDAIHNGLQDLRSDGQEVKVLEQLKTALDDYTKAVREDSASDSKATVALLDAVKAIKVAPVVNVPAPHVTVQAPQVNLKPLQQTLQDYFSEEDQGEALDLSCFRPQDIKESGDVQYVGFEHPNGQWYILENDVKSGQMRYVFGQEGYAAAFTKAASYRYSYLSEAVHALTA